MDTTLLEDYAAFLYKQIWPVPWKALTEEHKSYWRKESQSQLEWLENHGIDISKYERKE